MFPVAVLTLACAAAHPSPPAPYARTEVAIPAMPTTSLLEAVRARHAAGEPLHTEDIRALCVRHGAEPPGVPPQQWNAAEALLGPPLRVLVTTHTQPAPTVPRTPPVPVMPAPPSGGVPMPYVYRATLREDDPTWRWERRILDPATRAPAPVGDWEPLP